MFDDLAAQDDVEGSIAERKPIQLDVEQMRGEIDRGLAAGLEVPINDRLRFPMPAPAAPFLRRSEVIGEDEVEVGKLAQKHRHEVRVRSELEALAPKATDERVGADKPPKILAAIGQELVR